MNKATNKIQEKLVKEIVLSLKKEKIPWKKTWNDVNYVHHNPLTNNTYKNNNQLMLQIISVVRGYSDPRWMTFDQASKAGYKIKKGSVSVPLEKWGAYDTVNKRDISISSVNKLGPEERKNIRIYSSVFNVFNADCIDGIPKLEVKEVKFNNLYAIEAITNVVSEMGIEILNGQPAYIPKSDNIRMPAVGDFLNEEEYYGTLLHELGHATGHSNRLNRDQTGVFGSESYAEEEIVAEFSSILTGVEIGVKYEMVIENTKAYCQNWIQKLNDNPEILTECISKAIDAKKYLVEKAKLEEVEKTMEARKEQLIEEKIETIKAKQINVSELSSSEIQSLKMELEAYHNGYLTVEEYQQTKNRKLNKNVKLDDLKNKIQITDYAKHLGFNLVKQGNMHSLEEHDSCKIYEDNHFYRFSSKIGGSIIDFIKEFQNVDTSTAIKYAENYYNENNLDNATAIRMKSATKQLEIPTKVNTFAEVRKYLTNSRKIDKALVNKYIDDGILFQDDHANCVFVGKDANAKNKAYYLRSSKSKWMGMTGGSDAQIGIFVKGDSNSKSLIVHEAVIDQMSYIQMNDPEIEKNYLATQSVNNVEKAIDYHLKNRQSEINEVVLALDNDEPGREAIERATLFLSENYPDIEVYYDLPMSKDYNQDLKSNFNEIEEGVDVECQLEV